jgi:hypothetical protein
MKAKDVDPEQSGLKTLEIILIPTPLSTRLALLAGPKRRLDPLAFDKLELDKGLRGQPMALGLAFGTSRIEPQEISSLADTVLAISVLVGRVGGVSLTCSSALFCCRRSTRKRS